MTIKFEGTKYGFIYGSAEIERAVSDDNKGWVVLFLSTPRHKRDFHIYVTRTGKVRIFNKDGEWKPQKIKK